MAQDQTLEPIVQSVHVDCPIEDAFDLFTDRFGEWWPLAEHSVSGEDAAGGEIEPWSGGRVFERTRSGQERYWGTVVEWDPPSRLEFTWARGRVAVEFSVEADGTRVTVTHTGWESAATPSCVMCARMAQGFAHFVAQLLVAA